MRTILILAVVAGLGASGIALADNQRRNDTGTQSSSVSAPDLKLDIDQMGYDVRALKSDGDVYKAYLIDRQSGGAVKAAFNEKTGELVGAKLAGDDRGGDRREAGEHQERRGHESSREHESPDEHESSRHHERRGSHD